MRVLDVFSWLPAKEISIEELEQIFTGHLNGTYEGEYKVLLEVPDNADKNTEGRKGIHADASNESKQHGIFWQDLFHPGSQAEFGVGTVEEHCEQEKRTQDLSLIFSGPPGVGVVLREIFPNGVQIE